MEGVFEVGVFVCFILAFLRGRFGERRRAIQNKTDNTVPQHFNHSEQQLKQEYPTNIFRRIDYTMS